MPRVIVRNLLKQVQVINPAIKQDDGSYRMITKQLEPMRKGGEQGVVVLENCNPLLGDLVDKRDSGRIVFTVLEN